MAKLGTTVLLIASLLVVVTLADGRITVQLDTGFTSQVPTWLPGLACIKAYGVQAGETCFSLAQSAGVALDQFLFFNPNIDCDKLFVAQWVCLRAMNGA